MLPSTALHHDAYAGSCSSRRRPSGSEAALPSACGPTARTRPAAPTPPPWSTSAPGLRPALRLPAASSSLGRPSKRDGESRSRRSTSRCDERRRWPLAKVQKRRGAVVDRRAPAPHPGQLTLGGTWVTISAEATVLGHDDAALPSPAWRWSSSAGTADPDLLVERTVLGRLTSSVSALMGSLIKKRRKRDAQEEAQEDAEAHPLAAPRRQVAHSSTCSRARRPAAAARRLGLPDRATSSSAAAPSSRSISSATIPATSASESSRRATLGHAGRERGRPPRRSRWRPAPYGGRLGCRCRGPHGLLQLRPHRRACGLSKRPHPPGGAIDFRERPLDEPGAAAAGQHRRDAGGVAQPVPELGQPGLDDAAPPARGRWGRRPSGRRARPTPGRRPAVEQPNGGVSSVQGALDGRRAAPAPRRCR